MILVNCIISPGKLQKTTAMAPPSAVWAHFTKILENKKVKCSLCSQELAYCNSTTSLANHLFQKHNIDVRGATSNPAKRGRVEQNNETDDNQV